MPELHHKPSKAELEANIAKYQQTIDGLPKDPPADPPKPSEPAPAPTPSTPVPAPSTPIPSPSAPVPSPSEPVPTPGVDYKKKFSESSREAQVQGFKNKEINKAIEDAAGLPEPTEDELKKEYSEWEEMTPTEQRLAKDNLLNKRKFELIHTATAKFKQVDDWNEKVDTFVTDPKTLIANPDLEGKTEEFKQFAGKPTRRGVDFDDLVLAFLGEQAKTKTAPKKGKMFETGSGGGAAPAPKPEDGKISAAEGRVLMKTDYNKFKEFLKAGKIRNE